MFYSMHLISFLVQTSCFAQKGEDGRFRESMEQDQNKAVGADRGRMK